MNQQDPADVVGLFSPAPELTYLDSATYGLPPRTTVEALRRAALGWQAGTAHWIEDWDREAETCRRLFAGLIGAAQREVALMPAVSVASGIVATAFGPEDEVLIAEGEFTSIVYPFLAAQERGRLRVREAPLEGLAEAVRPETSLVAVSQVQSSNGRVADLKAIDEAARRLGARVYVDASQGLGALPIDVRALDVDYLACAAYKWLCCPRGVAFLYVREECWDEPFSVVASWRGGDDPYGRFYGSPLALSGDAARFDVSLAWHAWVGARHSLEALTALDDETRFRLAHEPACRLADLCGLPAPGSSIVAVPVTDSRRAGEAMKDAGIKVSVRAGQIRVASHFYNTVADVERAAEVLRPFVASPGG